MSQLLSACLLSLICVGVVKAEDAERVNRSISNILDDAVEAVVARSPRVKDWDYADVAAMRACLGQYEAAYRMTDAIRTKKLKRAAYEVIAVSHAKQGDYRQAMNAARLAGADSTVAAEIGLIQAIQGDLDGAEKTILRVNDVWTKGSSLLELAILHVKAGNRDSGERLLTLGDNILQTVKHDPATLTEKLAIAHGWLGHKEEWRILVRRLQDLPTDNFMTASIASLEEVAVQAAIAGDIDGAITTARSIRVDSQHRGEAIRRIGAIMLTGESDVPAFKLALSVEPGSTLWRETLLSEITRWRIRKGQLDEALTSAKLISLDGMRARALIEVARANIAKGHDEKGRHVLKQTTEVINSWGENTDRADVHSRKAEVLAELARVQMLRGDKDGARDSLRRALGIAREIRYFDLTSGFSWEHFALIVAVQLELRDVAKAKQTLELARNILARESRRRPATLGLAYSYSLQQIAVWFVKIGDLNRALEIAVPANGNEPYEVVYCELAFFFGVEGRKESALKWINETVPDAAKAAVLLSLAEGMLKRQSLAYQRPSWPL